MMILNDLQQDVLIEQMGQLTAAINGALNNSAAAAKDKALRDIATLLRVPIWSLTEPAQAFRSVKGSDSSTSDDVPKSEPIEQEVELPAVTATPAGAPSFVFEVIPEEDAPTPPVNVNATDGTPARYGGIPEAEAAPTHFYLCVTCGYEAAGPATLEAHQRVHVVPPPPVRETKAGTVSSNMTPEEEANWLKAMASGERITDDGPSPAVVAPRPRQDIPRSSTAGDTCRWCAKQCGGEAARKTHESYCEARPMAKAKEGEHVHHWKMESPNGPIVPGRCDCGATREDPASPEPIAKTSERPGAYDRGPVACDVCGTLVGRGAGMASHKRSAHPAEAVAS